ncbi:cellulose biosynthesis protein BcsP [Caballeronia sp. LZ062]|uniref:cellulose biosynthesis protein BcsP n=1 Tax=unclassified Caballeronia TaxID=2646786 RepID=UPI00285F929F|nr:MULTISPECIES: cellulose biosynthesis protein BcsP [unclassified Caballeronia]MDR5857646.1 cellulose biosynthesis protein BcsP [Caballeronia sp. LZ050]MDR5869196.1 cellulose biosynthesis protein BcsP [Caballeronia sp. LZ062]
MSTSRDIEKLFDHFGGNAGDYQEIGRENEAKSARTRWPLLATLDFAQPAIPEIAPRRAAPTSSSEPASTQPAATAIQRGKRQLFMRGHRRNIPPVNAPAAESLGASRFSATDESVSPATGMTPDSAASVTNGPAAIRGFSFEANALERQVPPAVPAPEHQPQPQSILGKLFKPQIEPATNAPADSLDAMFERLRRAGRPATELTNTQAGAGHASRAGRLPRL